MEIVGDCHEWRKVVQILSLTNSFTANQNAERFSKESFGLLLIHPVLDSAKYRGGVVQAEQQCV